MKQLINAQLTERELAVTGTVARVVVRLPQPAKPDAYRE